MQEIWLPVFGFESEYEVSTLGSIRSLPRTLRVRGDGTARRSGKVLKPWRMGEYLGVSLSKDNCVKKQYVHRLVATAFCHNRREGDEVSHKNHDRSDNRADNLEWSTHQENEDHKHRSGRRVVGSKIGGAKLTTEDVTEIQLMLIQRIPQSAIAVMFEVTQTTISRINRGECWSHFTVLQPQIQQETEIQ